MALMGTVLEESKVHSPVGDIKLAFGVILGVVAGDVGKATGDVSLLRLC